MYVPRAISAYTPIRVLCAILLTIGTLSLAGRFWARIAQRSQFRIDDWLMVPAWVSFVGVCACMVEATYIHTLGYTPAEAAPYNLEPTDGAKVQITIDIMLAICLGSVKLSALFFYRRVFCGSSGGGERPRTAFMTLLDVTAVAVGLWTVAYIIFPLSMCGAHIDGYWNRLEWNHYCHPGHPYLVSSSVTDVFFDLAIVVLPISKIWQLQTTTQRRLGVMLIFLTALFALSSSVARLAIVVCFATEAVADTAAATLTNSSIFFMWTLECGLALVATNMPSLWYFRTRALPTRVVRSWRSLRVAIATTDSFSSLQWPRPVRGSVALRNSELYAAAPADEVRMHASVRHMPPLAKAVSNGSWGEDGWHGPVAKVSVGVAQSDSSSDVDHESLPENSIKVTSEITHVFEKAESFDSQATRR